MKTFRVTLGYTSRYENIAQAVLQIQSPNMARAERFADRLSCALYGQCGMGPFCEVEEEEKGQHG